jgi:two-component system sensor histidine kinase DegS
MADEPLRIGIREARRLKERFLTRARAVFYARIAFLVVGVGILAIPSWRQMFGVEGPWAIAAFLFACGYSVAAHVFARHPRHGRWVMFTTLNIDLILLLVLISSSGGLKSPAMGAVVMFTIFFALLFPNPIAIFPPLLLLPVVMRVSQTLPDRPPFSIELLYLLWYAVLNGVAVYVIVYLTGREEKQHREILELEQELKKLAVVEERNRLARDIHDGLGAALSGLIIQAEYLQTLARGNDELLREIAELKSAAEEAIDEVRRALTMMRDEFDLVPQLENTCSTFTTRNRIPARLELNGVPPPLSDEQQLAIFRIMQECLTNAAKHAEAKVVTVRVNFDDRSARVEIHDDGKGFDTSKTPKHHYGLINMRERARKIGGEVTIDSAPGQGTRITLTVRRKPDLTVPILPPADVLSA